MLLPPGDARPRPRPVQLVRSNDRQSRQAALPVTPQTEGARLARTGIPPRPPAADGKVAVRDRVRYHSPALIEKLLEWCEANALARARAVVAIGLAYIYGLNEHQIAAARLAPKDTAVTITYPLARREAEIDNAEFGTLRA